MSMKGIKEARSATIKLTERVTGPNTERALTAGASIGRAEAARLTPVDLSTLINSQYMEIVPTRNGWQARVGYTAEYAAAVHKMSGKLKGQPRAHFGRTSEEKGSKEFGGGSLQGNYWDPTAEPEFLTKGFVNKLDLIKRVIVEESKL